VKISDRAIQRQIDALETKIGEIKKIDDEVFVYVTFKDGRRERLLWAEAVYPVLEGEVEEISGNGGEPENLLKALMKGEENNE